LALHLISINKTAFAMKKIYSLSIALLAFFQTQAQWVPIYETTETNFYTLYALDKERVFLGSEIPAVHLSNDGGSSFSLAELQPFGFVQSIAFENDLIGYAGGGCYFPFDQCPGNTFYRTEDGGTTWDTLLSDMNIGVFTEIAALGGGNLFAISDYGGMFHSPNGGLSWQPVLVQNTNFPAFGHMQFLDALQGFVATRTVVSANNAVERLHFTADGGANWSIIYEVASFPIQIIDFHFTDAQHGVMAVSGGKLLHTVNGGTNWSEQVFGSSDEQVTDLFVVNTNTAYMSSFQQMSNQSRIYRSNDGGGSWIVDMELDSSFIGKLYFVDKENGWALANYRQLLQRTGIDAVDETGAAIPFKFFPNPISELFTFQNPSKEPGLSLLVNDAMGHSLKTVTLSQGDNRVSLVGIVAGFYFLSVINEDGQIIWKERLVKE